jgi:hypothetical protein
LFRSPLWTADEWDHFRASQLAFPVIGTICGFAFIAFLFFTTSMKDSYLFIIYTGLSLIASFSAFRLNQETMDEGFCYDNAIPIKQHEDQPDANSSACVGQAAVLVYTFMACCSTFLAIAIEWRLKFFHPKRYETVLTKYFTPYLLFQIMICLILPLIPMIYSYSQELLGYGRSSAWCFIREYPSGPENLDMAVIGLPILIVTAIQSLIYFDRDLAGLILIWKPDGIFGERKAANAEIAAGRSLSIASPRIFGESSKKENPMPTSANGSGGNEQQSLSPRELSNTAVYDKSLYIAIGVTIFFCGFIFLPYIASRFMVYQYRDDYLNSLKAWAQCVFSHYSPSHPSTAYDTCGEHSALRPPDSTIPAQSYCLTGNMIIIGPVFMLTYAISYCYYRRGKYAKIDTMDQRVVNNRKVVPVNGNGNDNSPNKGSPNQTQTKTNSNEDMGFNNVPLVVAESIDGDMELMKRLENDV